MPSTISYNCCHGQPSNFSSLLILGFQSFAVSGLNALRTSYMWLWPPYLANEDPCLPQTWSEIECNIDFNPRVTALYLGRKDLSNPLPDFNSMDALEIIDLHGNIGLTGAIPSFLGKFPKLKVLNLANNGFSGLIPDSLACNNKLDLSLAGNTNLYTSSSCTTSKTESPPPPTRPNPNTPSDGTFESPRTIPSTPSGGTYESPRTIPGTPSGGTFESPRTSSLPHFFNKWETTKSKS
ncbi:unnamed protein product [Fraxinus pennsylvanica]|uniref:Leucine-rich repeat-containing N-terminal plant-type domain-containing protein n=1 Tax=Fraxinus pennsylvanica TaxID=56036 RepID=A0AAD1YQG1_9LAMI|nr:unnamed protein product [Fraxinus pennsylvanica]